MTIAVYNLNSVQKFRNYRSVLWKGQLGAATTRGFLMEFNLAILSLAALITAPQPGLPTFSDIMSLVEENTFPYCKVGHTVSLFKKYLNH